MSFANIVSRAGNEVLQINPPSPEVDIHLTNHGSDWLWAAFSVFALFAVINGFIYGFTGFNTNALKKIFFIYPLFTTAILSYTYFTYASNLGSAYTPVEFHHVTTDEGLGHRQVFYVKYIGYFLSWPFVLTIFEISTHTLEYTNEAADLVSKIFHLFQGLFVKFLLTEIFVLGLLIGILIKSTYKWGYFTFAVTAQLYAIYLVVYNLAESSRARKVNTLSLFLIVFQIVVWILYPVAWGLSEGGNVIQPDSEAVFYGVLDLITFAFVPTALTWLNVSSVDDEFFHKLVRFDLAEKNPGVASPTEDVEKSIGETPRHSGDTAVQTNNNTGAEAQL